MTLVHWDEVEARRWEHTGLGGEWTNLGTAAGSVIAGVNRIQLADGEVSTPAHVHGADEEIFFVLAGSGLSWQNGLTYEIAVGPPLACDGEACQPPVPQPGEAAPGSASFVGGGNRVRCGHHKVRRAGRCVRKKTERNHKRKTHRHRHKRGSSGHGGHR